MVGQSGAALSSGLQARGGQSCRARARTRVLLGILLPLWFIPNEARANWIDDELAARRICGPQFKGLDMLTADGPGVLLGRPAVEWTQSDLDSLPAVIKTCKKVSTIQGAPVDLEFWLEDIPKAVHQAWSVRSIQIEQTEAEQRVMADRAKRKLDREHEERAHAERKAREAETERAQILEEVQEEEARSKAQIAEANARRDIDLARQRKAHAEAEARRAIADADAARNLADQEVGASVLKPIPDTRPSETRAHPDGSGGPRAAPVSKLDQNVDTRPQSAGGGPYFAFSANAFMDRYGAQLKSDGDSGLADCRTNARVRQCRFDDAAFRKSVEAFKSLDLANGHFDLQLMLTIETQADHATRISLTGDRSDPMNPSAFWGAFGSLLETLEPGIKEDDIAALGLDQLGLARGEDDKTTGQARVAMRKDFAVTCAQTGFPDETAMGCEFEPRS